MDNHWKTLLPFMEKQINKQSIKIHSGMSNQELIRYFVLCKYQIMLFNRVDNGESFNLLKGGQPIKINEQVLIELGDVAKYLHVKLQQIKAIKKERKWPCEDFKRMYHEEVRGLCNFLKAESI
jgi:hypothetical protein